MVELSDRLQTLKSEGRKLIGCFPLYPPVELLHSLGLEPLVMWGLKPFFPKTTKSDRHLQNFVCSVGRHLTEFLLSEHGAQLDGLLMYNACDTLRNLPEILSSGLEIEGRETDILNFHIPMVSRAQTDASQYFKNEINALIEKIEEVFGESFSQEKFINSIELYGKARGLSKQLEGLVSEGKMGFEQFSNLMHGNYFRSVEKQIEVMESSLRKIEKIMRDSNGNGTIGNVILSGILPPPGEICSMIEASGLRVVGNDIASLARSYYYTPDKPIVPTDFYTDFYSNHYPCTTLLGLADNRIKALDFLVEEREAQGVIFIGEKFCEYEYFEFPYLEKRFAEKGLRTLLLEFAMEDDQNLAAYKTRIEAFAELMA